MKSIFLILGLTILMVSCQKSDDEPYKNFNSSDYDLIPEQYQEINRVFTFKNEQNDEVQIKSTFYNLNKEFESGIGFGQPVTDSYYYDDLWIGLNY